MEPRRRRIVTAGAIALPAVTLGFSMAIIPLVIATFVLIIVLVGGVISGGGGAGVAFVSFLAVLVGIMAVGNNPGLVLIPVVGGLAFFIAGILLSVTLLKRAGIARPRAVTWAGVGVGLAAQLAANGLVYVIVLIAFALFGEGGTSAFFLGNEVLPTIVFLIIAIPVTAVLGAVLWIAMERAVSRRSPTAVTTH